ncbi:transposase [Allisonella histaminiformans]|uniref:transposase n=1 Tax=Allisonella histaminiformans TaxID=209880 RepID=UPI0039B044E4
MPCIRLIRESWKASNNKIKVLKRIGYGYRNMDYFFTLIRFNSLPVDYSSPKIP